MECKAPHCRKVCYSMRNDMNHMMKVDVVFADLCLIRFIQEARSHCEHVLAAITRFKANKAVVTKNCQDMKTMLLVSIDKNYVYSVEEFEARQKSYLNLQE